MILPCIIKNEPPPNGLIALIQDAGMRPDLTRTVYTYGEAIYNPACLDTSPDLVAHEMTHMRQQRETKGGPDGWWERYLSDPLFRVQMEAEAYGAQWKYICSKKKGRTAQLNMLVVLSNVLSGPMYGSVITPEAATKMIQDEAAKV